MKRGRIIRTDDERCIVTQAFCTTSPLDRMRGLLAKPPLTADQALLIQPCNSVHTFAMGYALDLVYLQQDGTICKLIHALKPWRMSACRGAHMVIEMSAGRILALGLATGQKLRWEN